MLFNSLLTYQNNLKAQTTKQDTSLIIKDTNQSVHFILRRVTKNVMP